MPGTHTNGRVHPRWLDHEQQQAWLAVVALLIRLPGALEEDLERRSDLSLFEYLVLSALSEAPERTLRMSELAARANLSLSRLSHVVARLEKRDWVRRSPWPQDGRHTIAVFTQEGFGKIAESAAVHVNAVRALVVDPLTAAQLAQLREAAEAILARVDARGIRPVR